MEITNTLLSITPIYIAIFAILFVPITMRVGIYRGKKKILLGYGDDEKLNTLIRGQGNFIESVPLALISLLVMELLGAGAGWLHTLGVLLIVGRSLHYLAITGAAHALCRPFGMLITFSVILVASGYNLVAVLA